MPIFTNNTTIIVSNFKPDIDFARRAKMKELKKIIDTRQKII